MLYLWSAAVVNCKMSARWQQLHGCTCLFFCAGICFFASVAARLARRRERCGERIYLDRRCIDASFLSFLCAHALADAQHGRR